MVQSLFIAIMPLETPPAPEITENTDLEEELAAPWKVIVLNDPVNLMNYVVDCSGPPEVIVCITPKVSKKA